MRRVVVADVHDPEDLVRHASALICDQRFGVGHAETTAQALHAATMAGWKPHGVVLVEDGNFLVPVHVKA